MIYTAGQPRKSLSPSEALYGFGGWLTTRDTPVVMSAHDDAGIVAKLISEFCERHSFDEPRDHWEDNLIPSKD
ncbi:hypothetical protein LCGC14_2471290 [marine sediment metagenome]|uniref:Uncharacterized protein n=1 Tax=marine sediment metagenome TaxID=412755 RepID=A0A0F9BY46_9ZZZZ